MDFAIDKCYYLGVRRDVKHLQIPDDPGERVKGGDNMSNNDYKLFKQRVRESDNLGDPIYCAGYLWLRLTDKQINNLVNDVLFNSPLWHIVPGTDNKITNNFIILTFEKGLNNE